MISSFVCLIDNFEYDGYEGLNRLFWGVMDSYCNVDYPTAHFSFVANPKLRLENVTVTIVCVFCTIGGVCDALNPDSNS